MGDGGFLAMHAHHVPSRSSVVKALSVNVGRQPVFDGIVSYVAPGEGMSVAMDGAAITALRTGAVVGVATDLLAPVDARVLTLVGLGRLASEELRAVCAVRGIQTVWLVGRTLPRAQRFREMAAAEFPDLEFLYRTDADEAVAEADVVCCATPATSPLFRAASLADRVH